MRRFPTLTPGPLFFLLVAAAMGPVGPSSADAVFDVFAPDTKSRQVLHVAVRAGADGVEAGLGDALALPFGPSGLVAHRGGRRIIATSAGAPDGGPHQAADLAVDADGGLRIAGTAELDGPTGYTSVDRTGRFFLSSHYRSGAVGVVRIGPEGGLGERTHAGATPTPTAHSILTTPDNRFAYVPCVKEHNALYQYAFDDTAGTLTPLEPFDARPPAMFGPRHVAFHPSRPIAYFSNEQQLGVSVYAIGDDGQLTGLQHATTRPRRAPYTKGVRGLHASDLAISPDGAWLFVAVRDFAGDDDAVYGFRVEADGRLSLASRTLVGDIPWALAISPGGGHLLVSTVGDRRLAVFVVDADGGLTPAAQLDWGVAARDLVVVDAR